MLSLFFLFCALLQRAENWVTEHLQLSFESTGPCFLPFLFLTDSYVMFFWQHIYKQATAILVLSSAEKI